MIWYLCEIQEAVEKDEGHAVHALSAGLNPRLVERLVGWNHVGVTQEGYG